MNDVLGYCRPETLEALTQAVRSERHAKFLAGGTDLLVRLRAGRIDCGAMIDLSGLTELRGISLGNDSLTVGSMTRMAELARSEPVRACAPALAAAASQVGSPLIRNRGTIGGNVANCAAAGDTIPVLLALDARANLIGPGEKKSLPAAALLGGVNTSTLAEDELIVSFDLPVRGKASAFVKFGPRKALAISNLSLALAAFVRDGVLHEAAVALGAVGVTAYRVPEIEARLEGVSLRDAEALESAALRLGEIVFERLGGRPEMPFKAPYKRNLAVAALKRAAARLGEEESL